MERPSLFSLGYGIGVRGNYRTNSICFKGSHEMTLAKLLLASVLMTVVATTTARADPNQYLCTVEHAAGLRYDKQTGAWHTQEFGSKKYILRRLTDDDRDEKKSLHWPLVSNPQANWAFFDFDKNDPPILLASCVEDKVAEMLYCKPNLADAVFDKDTRRFEVVYHGAYVVQGYWEQRRRESPTAKLAGNPSKPDDLVIEIGNCSPS
jgi:hypothetical protein